MTLRVRVRISARFRLAIRFCQKGFVVRLTFSPGLGLVIYDKIVLWLEQGQN